MLCIWFGLSIVHIKSIFLCCHSGGCSQKCPILPFHNRTLPTALRTQAQICTFCMIYISCIFCIWEGCYCCGEPGAVKVRFSTTALTAVTSCQQPWELFQAVNSFTNMLYGYYLKDGVVISDWFLQSTVCTTDFKLSFMIVCSALEVYKVLLSFFIIYDLLLYFHFEFFENICRALLQLISVCTFSIILD